MVGIEISIEVRPDKRAEFLQAVETLRPLGEEGKHCHSQEIYEDHEQRNRFLWVERWQNDDLLETRLCSDRFRALLGAVKVLGTVGNMQLVVASEWTETSAAADGRNSTH